MAGRKPDALRQSLAGGPTCEARRYALVHFVRQIVEGSGTLPEAEVAAIKGAGYSDQQLADIRLAIALITYTNVFNRINEPDVEFPAVDCRQVVWISRPSTERRGKDERSEERRIGKECVRTLKT